MRGGEGKVRRGWDDRTEDEKTEKKMNILIEYK
jgi:hypothetical protein